MTREALASLTRSRLRIGASWRIALSCASEETVPQQFQRSISSTSTPRCFIE